jgi:murein DD-endopeptidase MepM/ murein hydrolase activator NlpD
VSQADALGFQAAGTHRGAVGHGPAASQPAPAGQPPKVVSIAVAAAKPPGRHRKPSQGGRAAPAPPGYLNPLRGVSGLTPERVDEGVDFAGSGPVYALGDAVITNASGDNYGWPGGGWITYRLTDGPDDGLMVYVAEDVRPSVSVGQHVTATTVIANMFNGYDGIETGWAQPNGLAAESELPQAGGIGGNGPFPTRIGLNFDELLHSLGVPAAPNSTQPAFGVLPAAYPAT